MKKIEKFWVPWSKEIGYLGEYCHRDRKMVIKDMEINYARWDQKWSSLRKEGWKIIQVTFKPVKRKIRK